MKKLFVKYQKLIIVASIMTLILCIGGYIGYVYWKAPAVEVAYLSNGTLQDYISDTGLVEARNASRILSQANGQVASVDVAVGDQVTKGSTLLELASSQIDLQIKALESQLQRITAIYNDLRNPADETLQSAQLRIETLENQFDLAESQYQKSETLYSEGAISQSAFQAATSSFNIAKNELKIAINEFQLLERGGSDNLQKQYLAQIDEINFNIAQLKSTRGNYIVQAPISGTVTELNVREGDTVIAGFNIVSIADLSELFISSDILASKAHNLSEGAKATAIEVIDEKNLENITVSKVYPTAHTQISDLGIEQKRVHIELALPLESYGLRVGYELELEIITLEKAGVSYIPEEAVYTKNNQDYVLIKAGMRAKEIPIETGLKTSDYVEVISGLGEDEQVIVTASSHLKDGTFIKAAKDE